MTSPLPRLAYVTAGFPYPLTTGYLRHYHLLRGLAPSYQIHLYSLTGPTFDTEDIAGISPFVGEIDVFPRPPSGPGIRQRLDPGHPGPAAQAMARSLAGALGREMVDAVLLSGKDTAGVAAVVPPEIPLVVDLCDAASMRLTQEMTLAGPTRRVGLRVRRRGLRQVEKHLVDRGDVLLAASERDREALSSGREPDRAAEALVVPNGVDLEFWRRSASRLGDAVVFCGNLAYRPNADAARLLVHEVMPHVWARHPKAQATIVGAGASAALVQDLRHPLVEVTGVVDDVRPHLETAAVFAAPLRICSGIQNKLLEALAMEVPVVTTSVAAAGLAMGGDPPPVTLADDPAATGAAIIARLDMAHEHQGTTFREGREWVGTRFDWERNTRTVDSAIRSALAPIGASC